MPDFKTGVKPKDWRKEDRLEQTRHMQGGVQPPLSSDKLAARMRCIVEMAGCADSMADIGCDHGLIAKALVRGKRAAKVIACDISAPSLQKTIDLIREERLEEAILPRIGDGLSALSEGEAEVIVIAGMGGLLIRQILERGIHIAQSAKRLVLAPQGNEDEVRRFLYENGFGIMDERLAREGERFYQVISACAQESAQPLPGEIELLIGPRLLEKKEPVLREYLNFRIAELEKIIRDAKKGADTEEYIARIHCLKERMEEVFR